MGKVGWEGRKEWRWRAASPRPLSLAALRPTLTKSKSSTIHPFSLYPVVTAREAGCRAGAGRQSWNHQLSPSSPLLSCSYQVPPLSLSHTHVGENGRIRPGPSHGPLSPPADLRRLSCHYWAPLPPANGPPPVSNCVPFPIAGACQTVLIRRRKP